MRNRDGQLPPALSSCYNCVNLKRDDLERSNACNPRPLYIAPGR